MTEAYRILVTGAREATAEQDDFVVSVLYVAAMPHLQLGREVIIIEGRCPKGGVDRAAERWAKSAKGVIDEPHPADWNKHGRAAGNIRNTEMVRTGAHICLAFPGPKSTGTWDCLTKAGKAGIHVRIYPLGMS